MFIEVNLAFTGLFTIAAYFMNYHFTPCAIISTIIGTIIMLIATIINIIDYLLPHTTENIQDTSWHYIRDTDLHIFWKNRKKESYQEFVERINQINNDDKILEDDIKEHHNLLLFQDNYHHLNKRTRNFTFIGIVGFLVFFLLSFLFTLLSNLPQ